MSHKKNNINYDYFNEDDVEQEILSSKPTSFLILGKPRSGRKKLARLLAKSWNCVYIDVTELCEELAELKQLPKEILNNLHDGKTISDQEMLDEVSKKLRSNIVNHRGYVLTGTPSVEHNNASLYQSQIELLLNIHPQPDFIINLKMDNEDIMEMIANMKFDPTDRTFYTVDQYDPDMLEQKSEPLEKKKKKTSSRVSGSLTSSILGFSDVFEGDEEEREQTDAISEITMATMATVKKKLGPDDKPKTQLPADVLKRLITPQELMPVKNKPILDFFTSTLEPIFYNEFIAKWNVQRLFELNALKTADLLLTEILDRLKCFHNRPAFIPAPFYINLQVMEEEERRDRMINNSPENKIRKWGVVKSSVFEESLFTLSQEELEAEAAEEGESEIEEVPTIPPSEGMSAEDMISENESKDVGEDETIKLKAEELPKDPETVTSETYLTEEELFRKLAHVAKVDRKWKWRKSRWFQFCPVALTKGIITPGKIEYSVRYLDKIYALSSLEAMKTFVENPRPFLKPPWPKNHCKVVIIGFPYSGKTTASEALAKVYGAKVIDMKGIMEPALTEIARIHRQRTTRAVVQKFVEKIKEKTLRQRRKRSASTSPPPENTEIFTMSSNLDEEKKHFHSQQNISKFLDSQMTRDGYRSAKMSDDDVRDQDDDKKSQLRKDEEKEEEEEEEEKEEEVEKKEDDDDDDDAEEEEEDVMETFSDLMDLEVSKISLGEEEEQEQSLVSETDPDVVEAVEELMKNFVPELPPEDLVELLEEAIMKSQKELSCERKEEVQDGRWILDNFPLDLKYWESLMTSNTTTRPTTIFFLSDESLLKEILLSRWYNDNRREINEKIVKRIDGAVTKELMDERKNEFENLVDDLEMGEVVEAVTSPRSMRFSPHKGESAELEVEGDGRKLVLSQYQSSPTKMVEVEERRLTLASRHLSVKVDQPKLDAGDMMRMSVLRPMTAHTDYYRKEKIIDDDEDFDDDDDDDFSARFTSKFDAMSDLRKNSNVSNSGGGRREANVNANSNIFDDDMSRGGPSLALESLSERSSRTTIKQTNKQIRASRRTNVSFPQKDSKKLKKEQVLKSLGLAPDVSNEILLRNLNKFAIFRGGLSDDQFDADERVASSFRISRGNIMDNLTMTETISAEKMSDESREVIQVTCLIQNLLGLFSYLPLDGPERLAQEEEIQLVNEQLNAIMEYLKAFNVMFKKIIIGYRLAVPKSLYPMGLPSKRPMKIMSGVTAIPEGTDLGTDLGMDDEDNLEVEEEASVASAESESMTRMFERMEDEEEEKKEVDDSIDYAQDEAMIRQFRMMFHDMKYFISFLGNLSGLINQYWESRDTFSLVEEMTNHMEDMFRHKAKGGKETGETRTDTETEMEMEAEMEATEEEEEEEEEEVVVEPEEEEEEEIEEEETTELEEEEEEEESKSKKLETKEPVLYMTDIQKAHQKYNLGDSSYFCPVTLKELNILQPGSPEITANYRDKVYFFASEEARHKFLKKPHSYVVRKFPLEMPPLRLLIMGPPGSGKSTISRHLVNKLGICHIQFHRYLQEMIISRTKKMAQEDSEKTEEEVEDFDMLDKDEIKDRLRAMGKMEWEKKKENFTTTGSNTSLQQTSALENRSTSLEKVQKDTQTLLEAASLSEKEHAISSYLSTINQIPSQTNLPKHILEEILKEFWEGETFAKSGFILEDFPNNELELRQMVELGLYPDAILILETDVAESINRMLPNLMKKWREKMQKKLIFKEKLLEYYQEMKQEAMEQRKKELHAIKAKMADTIKAQKKAFTASKGVRFMASEEELSSTENLVMMEKFLLDFEVNHVLMNEFEDDDAEEEEEEEKEMDAEETIKQTIVQMYENSAESLARLIESLQDIQIPAITVNTSKRYSTTMFYLSQSLEPFLKKRNSLFEKVVPIPVALAEKMISQGYKTLSRFNRWCPVKLMDDNPTCDFPKGNVHTAVYRHFVYFLSSKAALIKFMHDPLYYICNAPTKVCIPIRCAIVGPPKSGKSSIADRLKTEYGVRRLSAGVAIRALIQDFPKAFLVKKILGVLCSGLAITPELTAKAISKILLDTDCNTNGYALDGCPISKELMESLEAQNIIPFRVFYLKISDEQAERQASNVTYDPSDLPRHPGMEIFQLQMETYKANEAPILDWYTEQRNNLVVIPMERSRWWVWIKVVGVLNEAIAYVQEYYEGISTNGVASLAGMSITQAEFKKRLGHFEEFCPVSLVDRDELVDLSLSKTIEYAAEYKGTYYRLAGKAELASFLKKHMGYVHNYCLPPPQCRPIRRSKDEVQKVIGIKIGLLGFCPVTYFEGDQLYGSLVKGNQEFAVQYLDTIYYFASEENLLKFMRSPKKYHNLKNPTIIPPDLPPLKYTSLPIPGYLEQSVSQDLIKALTAVGNFKPKYPFLSPKDSAIIYVALYLKAHNLQSSVFSRKRYHGKLKHFEDRCELIKFLNMNMSRTYKEDSERTSAFDSKLEEFFRLDKVAGKKRKMSFLSQI